MPSKERKLAKQLDDFCLFLHKAFNINHGGCCFVASVIADCLEEDDIKFEVAVCSKNEYKDFYDIGCESQYHYFILLADYGINDDGESEYQIFDNVSSIDLLDHYVECTWNDEYSKANNDFIKHIIKEIYVKLYETIYQRESNCICI